MVTKLIHGYLRRQIKEKKFQHRFTPPIPVPLLFYLSINRSAELVYFDYPLSLVTAACPDIKVFHLNWVEFVDPISILVLIPFSSLVDVDMW